MANKLTNLNERRTKMLDEKLPPQDIEAEKSVLGAILIENEALNTVTDIINTNDFYRETHRIIFDAMLQLNNRHEAIDIVTIVDILRKMEMLETVGGIAYVTSLPNSVATAANVKYHSKIIYEKSMLRKLINISTEIASKAYEGTEEISDQLDNAEKKIMDISTNRTTSDYVMIESLLMGAADHFQNLSENKGKLTGVPTGFTDLDTLTSGLHPSDFIILAARPSMGKTAFALNIMQNVALRSHKTIGLKKPYVVAFLVLK